MALMLKSLLTAAGPGSGTTPAFRLTLIWIVGCMLAFVTALNFLPASLVDGHYIPVGNDSFYHARRILDTVAHPNAFYEFDRRIDYPEGSWIPWPWGYDYGMAQIVRGALAVLGPRDPMSVLAYIPVFALTITIALVLAVASAVRLSMWMRALVVLTFGISPLTQTLHGVGMIDHHFAEHICILSAVLLGMLWLRNPGSKRRAAALGIVLGASVCIHNGLFILQLPVLAALLYAWLRRETLERGPVSWFAASLFVSTLLVALPAQALRQGAFEFWMLSWFHVYVAGCSAAIAVLLSRWPYSPRRLAMFIVIVAALCAPLGAQLLVGGDFIAGRMEVLKAVDEVQSPVMLAFDKDGARRISALYGYGIWLSPIWLCVILVQLFRERRPELRFFWIVSFGAMILLLFQLRFFYYGSIALYIVPVWCLDRLRESFPRFSKPLLAASCALAYGAAMPSVRAILYDRPVPGLDLAYANTQELYPALAGACRKTPGLLALGDSNEGHYIRYFTECSVLADNFRITPQNLQKLQLLDRLYGLSPAQLLAQAPAVRYVLVKLQGQYSNFPDGSRRPSTKAILRKVNGRLSVELLLSAPQELPTRFHKLYEIAPRGLPFPTAAVFEIVPRDLKATSGPGTAAGS